MHKHLNSLNRLVVSPLNSHIRNDNDVDLPRVPLVPRIGLLLSPYGRTDAVTGVEKSEGDGGGEVAVEAGDENEGLGRGHAVSMGVSKEDGKRKEETNVAF